MIEKKDVQLLIDNGTEESLTLDYKRSDSLGKTDRKKLEISKDVSSMANSAGGRIIYGVAEHNEPSKKHLPEQIDPVDLSEFTKEWLEQVISSNIQPKIPEVVITPVAIGTERAVFVVDIPQSNKCHQAKDKRYYKRYNFESVPMEDYEVKDILNRVEHPDLVLDFHLVYHFHKPPHPDTPLTQYCYLACTIKNVGAVLANYVNVIVKVSPQFTPKRTRLSEGEVLSYSYTNIVRDMIKHDEFGPGRNVPILPQMSHSQNSYLGYPITGQPYKVSDQIEVFWEIYADNAGLKSGLTSISTVIEENVRTADHKRIGAIPRQLDEYDNAIIY